MSNGNILRKFVEDYFTLNDVEFTVDKNDIYTAKFITVLANKIGKTRRFSFNRSIADDYGVDFITLNNDMIKYMLRDSLSKGKVIKAKLDVTFNVEKVKLKDIFIKKSEIISQNAIAFLYKISSTDTNYENIPEILRYILVDYETKSIINNEFVEEFHNIKLEKANFKFDPIHVQKCHTASFEYLDDEIQFKYSENETANKKQYDERVLELKRRHDEVIATCKVEEKKKLDRIKELNEKIANSRTYDAQNRYEQQRKSVEKKLEELRTVNNSKQLNSLNTTKFRIQEEKERYVFDINVHLLSAVVFQYDVQKLTLVSTKSNDESCATYNDLMKTFSYMCPLCKKESSEPIVSYEGHFCCKNCGSYDEKKGQYFCKKDNVERCFVTGNYVLKKEENYCKVSKKYYDSSLMIIDELGVRVSQLHIKKTHDGKYVNSNDAIYVEDRKVYYLPDEVEKCEYSGVYYPKKELEMTTGSEKKIIPKYVKICSITKLTFMPSEMEGDKAKFINSLTEKEISEIDIPEIKSEFKRNKVEIAENKIWIYILQRSFLLKKKRLYNKKEKKIVVV